MVIATHEFEELARQSAAQSGLSEARIVAVAHPIGGSSQAELDRRAESAIEDVMNQLLGRSAPSGSGPRVTR